MFFKPSIAVSLSVLGFLTASGVAETLLSFKDALSSQKNLSQFLNVLENSYPDLLNTLNGQKSPVTVLAPSNDAFAKTTYYPIVGPAFDNNDVGAIQNILSYHVVNGSHTSKDLLPTFQYFPTWLNNASYSNVTGGQRVGGVLQNEKELVWTSGQSSRSVVLDADIEFAGGVLHIVDTLVTPPTLFPGTAETFSTAAEPYQLTSFLGATYYAPNKSVPALAELLNSTADITIFVPNNVAMESVSDALEALAKNPAAFSRLLDYHIVIGNGGPLYSTSLQNATSLQTLSNTSLTITSASNSLFVNSARILTSDLLLANGVMHVIDTVLSPDDSNAQPQPSLATAKPVLSADSSPQVSQAPFTSYMPWNVVTQAAATSSGGAYGAATSTGYESPESTGGVKGAASGFSDGLRGTWWTSFGLFGFVAGVVAL